MLQAHHSQWGPSAAGTPASHELVMWQMLGGLAWQRPSPVQQGPDLQKDSLGGCLDFMHQTTSAMLMDLALFTTANMHARMATQSTFLEAARPVYRRLICREWWARNLSVHWLHQVTTSCTVRLHPGL